MIKTVPSYRKNETIFWRSEELHKTKLSILILPWGNRWDKEVCDDRLCWCLQFPAGDSVCCYPPARGYYTGSLPLWELPDRSQCFNLNSHYFSATPEVFSRSSEVFSTTRFFRTTAGVWCQSFPSPRWAANGFRTSFKRLPFMPLTSRSNQVVFAYDQSIGPRRIYRLSVGPPRRDPRIRHTWTCLQLSSAWGMDTGVVSGFNEAHCVKS